MVLRKYLPNLPKMARNDDIQGIQLWGDIALKPPQRPPQSDEQPPKSWTQNTKHKTLNTQHK